MGCLLSAVSMRGLVSDDTMKELAATEPEAVTAFIRETGSDDDS